MWNKLKPAGIIILVIGLPLLLMFGYWTTSITGILYNKELIPAHFEPGTMIMCGKIIVPTTNYVSDRYRVDFYYYDKDGKEQNIGGFVYKYDYDTMYIGYKYDLKIENHVGWKRIKTFSEGYLIK